MHNSSLHDLSLHDSSLQKVGFLLDGQEVLTYDRSQALPEQQKKYLDNMDKEMSAGIVLVDQSIAQPDLQQKSQFIALNCVNALMNDNDKMAIIMFTYLVNKMPDLKQVKAKIKVSDTGSEMRTDSSSKPEPGKRIGIEFVFDEVKSEGQKIHFQANPAVH